MYFLKIVFYKFYRFLQKYSKGSNEELWSFNAFAFSILFVFLNSVFLIFVAIRFLDIKFTNKFLILTFIFAWVIFAVIIERFFISSGRYKKILKEISDSNYKGKYGNKAVLTYLFISILCLAALVYFLVQQV